VQTGCGQGGWEAAIGPWRVGGAHQRQAMEGGAATSQRSYSAHTGRLDRPGNGLSAGRGTNDDA
jgi:hypothetical protein